ncbi:MAG: hypothetical protein EOL97_00270 [Spirochaetia bacterium]|nr:hypothetical protein [Spirochaetia bacterium]
MIKILKNLIYIFFSILLFYLYIPSFIDICKQVFKESEIIKYFLPALLCGVILIKIMIHRRSWFILTSSHESAHKIIAILFFSPIKEYHVNSDGSGAVVHSGKTLKRIIAYAPYFFFPLSSFLIIVSLFLKKDILMFFILIYGFTIGARITIILRDLKDFKIQTDITDYGIITSLITISTLLFISIGILISYLLAIGSLNGIKHFLFFWAF